MEDVHVNDSQNISRVGYAWQWKWTRIAVTNDNSWVVIGISAVSGDVASLEYVKNMISGCKDEQVSSTLLSNIGKRDLPVRTRQEEVAPPKQNARGGWFCNRIARQQSDVKQFYKIYKLTTLLYWYSNVFNYGNGNVDNPIC